MRSLGIFLVAGCLCVAGVSAEQADKPKAERKAENVQVLTGMSLRDIRAEMDMMSDALDVKCSHCHVAGNLASDANPNKIAARKMLQMTKSLNEIYFAGLPPAEGTTVGHVTCFTCHRGSTKPINSPTQLTSATK